jgi:glycosyltransferase involved in cell wall biosynthesis
MPDAEIIVAADGAIDDCGPLAISLGARVVVIPGPSGPAVARNTAAAVAAGDVFAFIDADVVVSQHALPGMSRLLETERELAAVFGAYDLLPFERNFMSQYKNLSHTYVHEVSSSTASTFWAGLGMIRADVFLAVGGFDERFRRPSIEDIELGHRLAAGGYRVRLDVRFRGRHLKRWTLGKIVATDILARGIPWTQLIYRSRALFNDLNTSTSLRLSVVLSVGLLASVTLGVFEPWGALAAPGFGAGLIALNFRYYRWLARTRGMLFAARAIPVHMLHHLCNGISFIAGTALHVCQQNGVHLPGALPATAWPIRDVAEAWSPPG